jgi:hypothetical protein
MNNTEKQNAEYILNNLYEDCFTYDQWDTSDPENWMAMRDGIVQIAEYLKVKIYDKRNT